MISYKVLPEIDYTFTSVGHHVVTVYIYFWPHIDWCESLLCEDSSLANGGNSIWKQSH